MAELFSLVIVLYRKVDKVRWRGYCSLVSKGGIVAFEQKSDTHETIVEICLDTFHFPFPSSSLCR